VRSPRQRQWTDAGGENNKKARGKICRGFIGF
jgi:hypothetical protein